jgi:hypothetical protein
MKEVLKIVYKNITFILLILDQNKNNHIILVPISSQICPCFLLNCNDIYSINRNNVDTKLFISLRISLTKSNITFVCFVLIHIVLSVLI